MSNLPHDLIMQTAFRAIVNQAKIGAIVETGTNAGDSTAIFAKMVPLVYTFELDKDLFFDAIHRFKDERGAFVLHGDSAVLLSWFANAICRTEWAEHKSVLFMLDAHWNSDWPLERELQEINKARANGYQCVTVIDDWFVRGSPQFAGCFGGLRSDQSKGRESELIPCGYNPPFDVELDRFPHFYEPIYESGGIGYSIFSDFPLLLGDNFRTNR